MRAARVLAPAKINVWLHVVGPRPDGFHDLFTVFQSLELCDEVTIHARDDATRSLGLSGPAVPTGGLGPERENLALRAAGAFQLRASWPRGFSIALVKNIPVGGGLGGGSADAGAVLRALNAMAPRPLEPQELLEIGASLGSDVPFFVTGATMAMASGRGEILSPLSDGAGALPPADVLLVIPAFGIATADAYRWLRESGAYDEPPDESTGGAFRPGAERSDWRGMDRGNTFERVVEPRYPVLRHYRERLLEAGASIARLSGSGSTVFGIFERGAPRPQDLGLDAVVIPTRTARHVVRVEVQQ